MRLSAWRGVRPSGSSQVANIDTLRVGGAMEGPRPMMMRAEAMAADAPPPTALPDLETIQSHVEAEITLTPR